jgi:hypothetical protein
MSFTEFASHFFTYCLWSMEAVVALPPFPIVAVCAAASLVIAFSRQKPLEHALWKKSHWLVLTQLLFFPVVVSLGVLYPASGPSFYNNVSNASRVSDVLFWFSVVLAGFWIYRMKGFRWFAFSLVLLLEVVLLGAFFVAGMALSGDWL